MAKLFGPGLVLLFCLSQALRDVYFGHVFQGVDFFAVILLAFLLSTAIFTVATVVRTPGEFRKLRGHRRAVLAMNAATAIAWSCYFFGLSHLEPSIVNTLHSAMGPLTVVALAAFGVRITRTKTGPIGWPEYFAYSGMALSLIGLWWVVLSDNSGLTPASVATAVTALALLVAGGASITISLLYCKRLHDHGISAEAVTSVRYVALILLAGGMVLFRGRFQGIDTPGSIATLSVAVTALIVLPLFAMQVGTALTAPLTGHVLRSLGPVFVFAFEQVDGRMSYSAPTLVCILGYSAFAIAANIAHGWHSATPASGRHARSGARA